MVIPCRDNLNLGVKYLSSNLKVPTLDIEIKNLKLTILHTKDPTSESENKSNLHRQSLGSGGLFTIWIQIKGLKNTQTYCFCSKSNNWKKYYRKIKFKWKICLIGQQLGVTRTKLLNPRAVASTQFFQKYRKNQNTLE